jgi:mRNA-degrading endonuclease toxin of MazEF toxin-antitoxin module
MPTWTPSSRASKRVRCPRTTGHDTCAIWWAGLPDPVASEPGYRRPVLIIQSNAFNRSRIHTVIVVVITTNLRLGEALLCRYADDVRRS